MRNPSSRSFSVRPLAAALLLGGAALVISEAAAPAPTPELQLAGAKG
jgi:hypothetical protein